MSNVRRCTFLKPARPTLQLSPHLRRLTECVREINRPIGMLLGAGCPTSVSDENGNPLAPDTKGLTEQIHDEIQGTEDQRAWTTIRELVEADDEMGVPNIESLLSRTRGLLRFTGGIEFHGLRREDLEALETTICEEIVAHVTATLPSEANGYNHLATWLGAVERQIPVELFTTNYDLLIEQALEAKNIPYFDGFVGARRPFFDPTSISQDDLPVRWARLWKIHGSINWISSEDDHGLRVWRSNSAAKDGAVIHPSHQKYDQSRKMPYLALIDRLQEFLTRPQAVLLVVGYSFGDEHLNEVILQALQGSAGSATFAFMYGDLANHPTAVKLAKRRNNLSVFARDKGVVSGRVDSWAARGDEPEENEGRVGAMWVAQEDETWREQCSLGDFSEFGAFLYAVTGRGD